MKLITNVCMVTAMTIGLPILFYLCFHGTSLSRQPDLDQLESGYVIKGEKEYDLDQYIVGILPGQVETTAELEAIKAQAIIVRTNLLRQMGEQKKIDADQIEEVYILEEKRKEQLGEREYERFLQILKKAVLETRGKVMREDGELITPLFHWVSVGTTISAKEMYGKEISYLQAVESSWDVEAEDYMKVELWEYETAVKKIKRQRKNSNITESDLKERIRISTKTRSGYIKKLTVGSETFTGEQWKSIFELNSTNFYIEDYEGQMRMITLGKGHGLGLSLYGANEMAKQGKTCNQILKHYYRGIEIATIYE